MAHEPFNFTKTTLINLPLPKIGKRTYFKDIQVRGLILDVRSSGAKSFYVYKKINGRPERILLGSFPAISIEQARKQAHIKIGQIAEGRNPQEEARRIRSEITFGELFAEYMERHSKPFKKSWRYDEEEVPRHLSHWYGRRLSNITRQDVQRLHEKLRHETGLYQANKTVQRMRSIVNKGIEWGWQGTNPTIGIKFYKERSRDRFIQPNEMPCLVRALNEEANELSRDFFWILLLTGARKTNTLMMRWEQINWQLQEWRIPETKNGDPVTVPLTERAIDILKRRKAAATSVWVFPQDNDPEKRFRDPRSAWQRILGRASLYLWAQDERLAPWLEIAIRKAPPAYVYGESVFKSVTKRAIREKVILPPSMTDIRLHDVRRTFGSYQALTGASLQVIGRSLGHKSIAATQIYARLNLDPVRASIEKATEAMFR